MSIDRRSFLKTSAAGAAGISLSGSLLSSATAAGASGWTDKMAINPLVSNLRVVCMLDDKMCPQQPNDNTLELNAKAIDAARVNKNMDQMAMTLTEKNSAEEAWKTIFRSSKPWADTKVMIKLNCVEAKMLANVAVIKKITDVLTAYGVQPKNIVLFDGQGMSPDPYKKFLSLTDATMIRGVLCGLNDWHKEGSAVGGKKAVKIPGIADGYAPGDLVSGAIDIIVNIAVNKGHNSSFNVGKTTLCLKNHFGTFLKENSGMSGLSAIHLHSAAGLINSNKVPELIGGDPVRQQLCIIDSLWGVKGGPNGSPDKKLDRLVMGTFAGAVDYAFVKKVREAIQKATHDANIPKFLTEFGYAETDPVWVEITPTGTTIEKVHPESPGASISFRMSHPAYRQSIVRFSIPDAHIAAVSITIYSLNGGQIAQINHSQHLPEVVWNGIASNGQLVNTGTYIVEVRAGGYKAAERFTVAR